MRAEAEGKLEVARARFTEAWDSQTNDVEACIAAHYLARHQGDPRATLRWNEEALRRADTASDPLATPSAAKRSQCQLRRRIPR